MTPTEIDRQKQHYQSGYSKNETAETLPRMRKVLDVIVKKIPQNPTNILDIGCGDGAFSSILGKKLNAGYVYGIDISPLAAEEATRKGIIAKNLDVDAGSLPYENGFFDFIYAGGLIELVRDPDHLLEELHRVLSPGGRLVITHSNICSWGSRISVLFGFHPFYDRISTRYDFGKIGRPLTKGASTGFIRMYNKASFIQMLKLYGFESLAVYGAREPALGGVLGSLDKLFSSFASFSFQNIHLARRSV